MPEVAIKGHELYLRKFVLEPRILDIPFALNGVHLFDPNKDI